MILVDTSIWIDHLHASEPRLGDFLEADEVGSHPLVIEELALGSIKERDTVLGLIGNLWRFPSITHDEQMTLVKERELWGRGLSAVDVHLLGSAAITPGARVWTRDKRLRAACRDGGVACIEES